MRVDTWRFTEWVAFDYNTSTPNWSVLYGRELYDHSDSPVPKDWAMEHENVAGKPAMAARCRTSALDQADSPWMWLRAVWVARLGKVGGKHDHIVPSAELGPRPVVAGGVAAVAVDDDDDLGLAQRGAVSAMYM